MGWILTENLSYPQAWFALRSPDGQEKPYTVGFLWKFFIELGMQS